MLVTIIYNTDFRVQADTLKADILQEWPDCRVNKMGIKNSIFGTKYQVQLKGNIVYTNQEPTDSTTIINSIKESL